MKRFLSLTISLALLIGFADTSLHAAAKKPGFLSKFHFFKEKTEEEKETIAKLKRIEEHRKLELRNHKYDQINGDYHFSETKIRCAISSHSLTSAILERHLARIAAYRAAIAALPPADQLIAQDEYTALMADNEKTKRLLAIIKERETTEAAAVPLPTTPADALELLGFDRTAMPNASAIKAHYARLYREHIGDTAMLQALNAAKALLTPAAAGTNEIDDDWVASAVDGK